MQRHCQIKSKLAHMIAARPCTSDAKLERAENPLGVSLELDMNIASFHF